MGPIIPWTGRTPAEAVEPLFVTLQLALSCVTTAVVQGRAYYPSPNPHAASFGDATPVPIGRRSRLRLDLVHFYDLVADERTRWRVKTAGYLYDLLDQEQRSVIAYHWHPTGLSLVRYPHLHVGAATASVDLSKAHLPTGHVSFIAVVRLAIAELGVEPLRPDWQAVLDQAERQFEG